MDKRVTRYLYILISLYLVFLLYLYVRHMAPIREGLGEGPLGALGNISSNVQSAMDEIKNLPDKIKKKFEGIGGIFSAVPNAFNTLQNKMNDSWKKFTDAFPAGFQTFKMELEGSVKDMNSGTGNVNAIMNKAYMDTLDGIVQTAEHFSLIGDYFSELGVFIWSYLYCGFSKIADIPYCFFYYALETIGYVFYMPIVFVIYIIRVSSGPDLRPMEKVLWDALYATDDYLYNFTGYHVVKYSPYVMKRCFHCDFAPMPTFPEEVFLADFEKLQNALANVSPDLKNAMDNEVIPAFQRMFNSVNASVNVTNKHVSDGFDGLQNSFKLAKVKLHDDIYNATHEPFPNLLPS